MKFKWRRWNIIIHRDLGYLAFGLTVIYAISGIAVNHIDSWNPNYQFEIVESQIAPITVDYDTKDELAQEVLHRLEIDQPYNSTFLPDPQSIEIYLDNHTVTVNYKTGDVSQEIVKNRPILRQFNFLHLNEPKKLWTYLADLYAGVLIVLSVTGLFMLKGKKGITGRGAWLTSIGILIPILFLWLYF